MKVHRCAFSLAILSGVLAVAAADGEQQQISATGLLGMVKRLTSGRNDFDLLEKPECLLTLEGGIERAEEVLLDQRRMLTVLKSATKNDPSSVTAVDQYYKAVRELCGGGGGGGSGSVVSAASTAAEPLEEIGKTTPELAAHIFDDAVQSTGRGAKAEYDRTRHTFAFLSFDDEPSMMWRWWIWKVPVVAFVTRSDDGAQRLYDVQFWKIAWSLPNSERIIDAIRGGLWRDQLTVWRSDFAPGGSLDSIGASMAYGFSGVYKVLDPIPTWLLTILGTMFGSLLISFLHRGEQQSEQREKRTRTQPDGEQRRSAGRGANSAEKKAQ